MQGTITNIQRFSIHDGPGIRTTVFLKGCNLRCFWCHNPEDMKPGPELQVFLDRCILCGACAECCPHGAHNGMNGLHRFQRDLCEACGACVDVCFAGGLGLVGEKMTVEQVIQVVLRDRTFFDTSSGGVTLSGGEPLMQLDFVQAILERCRQEELHTAIETSANVSWNHFETVLPLCDLVMVDIKMMDSDKHRRYAGVPNQRILNNIHQLGHQQPIVVRTPVIPGVNDWEEAIRAIARYVVNLPTLIYYELLPFHPLAENKYKSLGMEYPAAGLEAPTAEKMNSLREAARSVGVLVHD